MATPETIPTPKTMSLPTEPAPEDDLDREWIASPVDDATYDLIMALASKLEAIDTYEIYAEDGNPGLWRELATDEARHAARLFNELKQRIAA
jgi:predicted membrane GTPase involved in stress response